MYLMIVATLVSFVSVHSSVLGKPFMKWLGQTTQREKKLITEKNQLVNERNKISMVDNFAKHAKVQRKINAINRELGEIKSEKSSNSFYVQIFFTYGIRLIFFLLLLILSVYYRHTPVFRLSRDVNLFPLTYIISYPNEQNAVSFHFWVMCSTAVAKLIKVS